MTQLTADAVLMQSNKEQLQAIDNVDIQLAEQPNIQKVEEVAIQPVKENKWAEIVRKGRSKETPTAATPSNTATALPTSKAPPIPSSPTMSLTPSANSRNGTSVSPSRTRRSRGGARKREEAGSGKTSYIVCEAGRC